MPIGASAACATSLSPAHAACEHGSTPSATTPARDSRNDRIASPPAGKRPAANRERRRAPRYHVLQKVLVTHARGEPFDSPLMVSLSNHERLAQDALVEPRADGSSFRLR